ncbi:MAG: hypothetical protein ABH884_02355 [Candidatus Komeilibacteria bacterium]
MKEGGIIRTIYLYLFALVGLIVLVIGAGQLVDLGLKMTIFKNADANNYGYYERPMPVAFSSEKTQMESLQSCSEQCELTEVQIAAIDQWLIDYQIWQDEQASVKEIDYVRQNRERQASGAISMIIVGLPLYLYHWVTIKRDRKSKNA